jgi:hypothetical protein
MEERIAKQPWAKAGIEPGLQEVLADPIVVSLMKADRVTRKEVLTATARVSRPPARDEFSVAV